MEGEDGRDVMRNRWEWRIIGGITEVWAARLTGFGYDITGTGETVIEAMNDVLDQMARFNPTNDPRLPRPHEEGCRLVRKPL